MTKKLLKYLKILLPWLVALGLFLYLFNKIPPSQVLNSLKFVHLLPFLAFAAFYFLYVILIDTATLSKVISQFSAPLSFKQLWPARCVSYLLSIVNYNAGQAGIALYVKKTRGASLFKTLGAVFFVTAIDLYWIITLAFLGSFFIDMEIQGIALGQWVQRVSYVAFAALFLHLAFWRRWFGKILPFKFHFGFGDWLRGRHLFQTFHHAQLKDYFRIALYRLPLHVMFIGSLWALIRLFGAYLPWKDVFATVPIIFLFGALPVTPGGLGAVQIATVELLKNKISSPAISQGLVQPEELLFAMSLSWMAINYLYKVALGLYYWLSRPHTLFQDSEPGNAMHPSPKTH